MTVRPATLAAATILVAAPIWLVQYRLAAATGLGDLPVYQHASRLMRLGEVPYRDFALEYPPGGAGLFLVTDLLPGSFAATFSALMFVCLALAVAGVAAVCAACGRSTLQTAVAVAVTAVVPLAFGSLSQLRYDLLLTALLAWLVWAVVTERWVMVWTLIGCCLLVKLVPVVLVPLLAVLQLRQMSPRQVLRSMVPGAALVAAVLIPLLVVSPGGLWGSVAYHLERPLQVESLGAGLLIVAHHLGAGDVARVNSYGSDNLLGERADLVASVSGLLAMAGVLLVAWRFARHRDGPVSPDDAVAAIAATLLVFIAFGKVLSPQYLLWLAPLVVVLAGRRGMAAGLVIVAATALSYAVFPTLYRTYTEDLAALPAWLVLLRNTLLLLMLWIVWPRTSSVRRDGRAVARPTTG